MIMQCFPPITLLLLYILHLYIYQSIYIPNNHPSGINIPTNRFTIRIYTIQSPYWYIYMYIPTNDLTDDICTDPLVGVYRQPPECWYIYLSITLTMDYHPIILQLEYIPNYDIIVGVYCHQPLTCSI